MSFHSGKRPPMISRGTCTGIHAFQNVFDHVDKLAV